MTEPRDESPRITELDDWTQLITRDEWKHWVRLQQEHGKYLQTQVNRYVKAQEWTQAYAELQKMMDIEDQLHCVSRRIEILRKGGR